MSTRSINYKGGIRSRGVHLMTDDVTILTDWRSFSFNSALTSWKNFTNESYDWAFNLLLLELIRLIHPCGGRPCGRLVPLGTWDSQQRRLHPFFSFVHKEMSARMCFIYRSAILHRLARHHPPPHSLAGCLVRRSHYKGHRSGALWGVHSRPWRGGDVSSRLSCVSARWEIWWVE